MPVGGIPPGFFAENVPPPSPYPLFWYGDVPTGVQSQTRWITFDNASGANFQFAGDLIHIAKETGLENCPVVGSDDDSDGSLPAQDPDCIGWPTFLVPGMLQELCGNGIDDFSFAPDGADCADPTCAGNPACD